MDSEKLFVSDFICFITQKNLSVLLTGLNRRYLFVIFLLTADALMLFKLGFHIIIHITPKPYEINLGEEVLLCWQVQIKRSYQNNLTFSI